MKSPKKFNTNGKVCLLKEGSKSDLNKIKIILNFLIQFNFSECDSFKVSTADVTNLPKNFKGEYYKRMKAKNTTHEIYKQWDSSFFNTISFPHRIYYMQKETTSHAYRRRLLFLSVQPSSCCGRLAWAWNKSVVWGWFITTTVGNLNTHTLSVSWRFNILCE